MLDSQGLMGALMESIRSRGMPWAKGVQGVTGPRTLPNVPDDELDACSSDLKARSGWPALLSLEGGRLTWNAAN